MTAMREIPGSNPPSAVVFITTATVIRCLGYGLRTLMHA